MNRPRPGRAWIVVLSATALGTVPRARGDELELRSKLDAFMAARVADGGFSGSVLVARDGVPIFRRGYGMANLEHDVPNTPQTKFRLGSVTKQFTAAAVLILQERGRLDVRDRIKRYLPGCPAHWDEITIHHLLTHTSGIPSYTGLPDYARTMREPTTPDVLIARFRDRPLEFRPGERFAYSNSGYAVLGRLIAEVSGMPYAEFLRVNLFEPLGMDDSGYDHPATVLRQRASGYARKSRRVVNASYLDMTIPYAAGALYSTVDDLLKWDRALSTNRILSQKSTESMFTPTLNHYGYGWTVGSAFSRRSVSHGGTINGFVSEVRRFPEDRVCIVVLSNVEGTAVGSIGRGLAAIVFNEGADHQDDRVVKAGTPAAPATPTTPGEPARMP